MSSSAVMALRQIGIKAGAEQLNYWMAFPTSSSTLMDTVSSPKVKGGHTSATVDDTPVKIRKPYTITKQRERWTEDEHQKFLDALKLHGRAWRRIEEHIGTKTAVQIRSHAQKFFSKLEREASLGGLLATAGSGEIEIPPPRPKRKPSHPYPKKASGALSNSPSFEDETNSPPAVHSAFTPLENSSSGATDAKFLAKKARSSAASLRLFGQTMVQGVDEREVDNELMESTGSPRSQVSMGTEETSGVSPVVGYTSSVNQSALISSIKEPAFTETKSQLINATSEWEKCLLTANAPHFTGAHHLAPYIPPFWQGLVPPNFGYGMSDDANTANAIAAATYAVASAWQAIQGALITNASNESNSNIIYSPIAILAAAGKPIPVPTPTSPPHVQQHHRQEQGCHSHEHENDSEGTNLHGDESTTECCSSLTDSSRLSSYESNDERVPAKKRQRKSYDDNLLLHELPEALQSMKCEMIFKAHTDSRQSENFENINTGQSLPDEIMPSIEGNLQRSANKDAEQPNNFVIQGCGLGSSIGTEDGFKARGALKLNHDSGKEVVSSVSVCESEVSKACALKEHGEGLLSKRINGSQSGINHVHPESGEHLFMIKAGATLGLRYSGAGFVPYRKSASDSPTKHDN